MTGSGEPGAARRRNDWRIARWTAAVALLLTPLVMMRISDGWHWTPRSFVFAGIMIGGAGLLYEIAAWRGGGRAYRAGAAVAIAASFLTVWTTIVRDDDTGIGYLMLIMTAATGGFAAWFRPAGMARTMFGVAIMQALLGIAIATAPATAGTPGGSLRALLSSGFFAVLWLISSACFRAAAKAEQASAE